MNLDVRSTVKLKKARLMFILLFWFSTAMLFNYLTYLGGLISTIIGVAVFLCLKKIEKYLFIIAGLPFAAVFKMAASLPSSLVLIYFLFLLLHFGQKKIEKNSVFAFLLLILFQTLSCIVFDGFSLSIISFLLNVLFMKCMVDELHELQLDDRKNVFKYAAIVFSIAMILDILSALVFPELPYVISYDKAVALENVGRFSALNTDPNYFSQLLLISIGLLIPIIQEFFKNGKIVSAILLCLFEIVLVVYGIETKSKSFVVTMIVLFVLILALILLSKKRKLYQYALGMLAIVSVLIFAIWFYNDVLLRVFLERENSLGVLTGRDKIWSYYLDLFMSNPLTFILGMGFANGQNVIGSRTDASYAAHNAYLEILGDIGIVGILSLLAFLNIKSKKFGFSFKNSKYLFVIMIMVTSFALSISSFDSVYIFLPLMVCANTKGEKEDEL